MRIENDYRELLQLFNKHKIKYCILGAFAFAFHARPRYTKDMDIIIEPSIENSKNIITALHEFGFGSLNLTEKDLCQEGRFIQLGYEPVRIDLITSLEGLSFEQIWKNKVKGTYGGQKVFFIGLDDLIKAKKIANRKQDVVDLEILKDVKAQKKQK